MNNRDVAHAWAHGRMQSGKGSNFYFDGPVLYSYGQHFIVGYRDDSRGVWWITSEGYSVSTSRHISYALQAVPGEYLRVSQSLLSVIRSRGMGRELFASLGCELRDEKAAFTRAGRRKTARWAEDLKALNERIERFNALLGGEGFHVHTIDESEAEALLVKNRERKRERLAKAKAEIRERLAEWHRGERAYLSTKPVLGYDYLRLSADGPTVETTQGVRFPAADARAFWMIGGECVRERVTGRPEGERVRFGPYTLDRFDKGDIIAGCHRIPAEEAERLAGLLGFIDNEGAA